MSGRKLVENRKLVGYGCEPLRFFLPIFIMSTEPKTFRETNLVIAGLEARVGLILKMIWAVIGMLGTLMAGAVALLSQVGDVKSDLASVKASIVALNDRIAGLESGIRDVRSAQSSAATTLARIDTAVAAPPPKPGTNPTDLLRIVSSSFNAQYMREVLKPVPTGQRTYVLGERVSGLTVPLLPPAVIDKLPELTGLGYIFDAKGQIVLVDGSYRVAAIIVS
jgi:hypothetical protein